MVGINKQLLDYANAIEKLPKKKSKKRKGIASASVTRHDSGVPMEAVTSADKFGHELRDQNTVKDTGMKTLLEALKHLPGQHNQSSHAGGRGNATPGKEKKSPFSRPKDITEGVKVHRELNKYDLDVVADNADKTKPISGVAVEKSELPKIRKNAKKMGYVSKGKNNNLLFDDQGHNIHIDPKNGHVISYTSRYFKRPEDYPYGVM